MGVWSSLWHETAKDWAHGRIFDETCEDALITPQSSYVSVLIQRLRLVNSRIAFSRYYGAVQTYGKLSHLSGIPLEFSHVVVPPQLENVDRKTADNFIMAGKRVLGPAPYRGGDLELEIALLSIKSHDMIKPYLDLLAAISTAAGVAFATAATPYIGVLKRGIELLTAPNGAASLEVGVALSLDKPREGTYFAARVDASEESIKAFSVDDQYRLMDSQGHHIVDAPYVVFTITGSPVREDWFAEPDLSQAYTRLVDAIRDQSSLKAVNSYREYFGRVVRLSPDILPGHAEQIVAWVDATIAKAMPASKQVAHQTRYSCQIFQAAVSHLWESPRPRGLCSYTLGRRFVVVRRVVRKPYCHMFATDSQA